MEISVLKIGVAVFAGPNVYILWMNMFNPGWRFYHKSFQFGRTHICAHPSATYTSSRSALNSAIFRFSASTYSSTNLSMSGRSGRFVPLMSM
jgi:hypothetical protein